MAEGFKLRKLCPPFGTPESPLWEFGYDEQVRVVGGLCTVRSPAMRDRLVKMGYELAPEDASPPAGGEAEGTEAGPASEEVSSAPSESSAGSDDPSTGSPDPAAGSPDPAAAPEEQTNPGGA